ncbi:LysR family transcriptional regulator [Paenibacillus tuaregi]|uniref:LysR family transcriptional regulator n=1 Tax=Paenibacillus tuaregi TaxID=1816681 RepID=UPI000839159B|nr:LysR family transcriptional regulator [Paenibacillus tuaregi]
MDQALLVFITVVERGNFTRSAEELHMTQPAVSQYIQSLERAMGARLLDRTNKYVKLTRAGQIVYEHAVQMKGLYLKMHNLVDDLLHNAGGELTIGASYTYGEYILPHVIARLRTAYPLVKPRITIGNTRDIAAAVLHSHLEIGVVEGELQHEKLIVEPFAEDSMYIIVSGSHKWAGQGVIPAEEAAKEIWILREPGSGTRAAADKLFARLGFTPKETMEFGSTQIIKESVEAGLGITLLSSSAVRKEVSLGTLAMLQIPGAPVSRKFSWIMQNTEFRTRAAEVFIELLEPGIG